MATIHQVGAKERRQLIGLDPLAVMKGPRNPFHSTRG